MPQKEKCTAMTKKGTQCTRTATYGNLCAQHSAEGQTATKAKSLATKQVHVQKLTPAQQAILARGAKTPAQYRDEYNLQQLPFAMEGLNLKGGCWGSSSRRHSYVRRNCNSKFAYCK